MKALKIICIVVLAIFLVGFGMCSLIFGSQFVADWVKGYGSGQNGLIWLPIFGFLLAGVCGLGIWALARSLRSASSLGRGK